MFKENQAHRQTALFSGESLFSEKKRQRLRASKESAFYHLIFCNIQESDFASLYSENYSRPNAPVNGMVSALWLKHYKGWTYEELFEEIDFNLLTRCALGLRDIEETPFNMATLFNFQNRLIEHYVKTGENLLERVFDHMTVQQTKELKLKTEIQRTDSFLAAANIREFSRLQLLIEVIIRLKRVLSPVDQARLAEEAGEYLKDTSGKYIYRLRKEDVGQELERLGQLYHWIAVELVPRYAEQEIFRTFQRVYTEHFTVVDEKVQVVPSEELSSGSVQSPDDIEATYRQKGEEKSRGQVINIVETCHPDNELELIVDVAVNPNNKDDSTVLHERLPELKEKTPALEELHHDGAYGSAANDALMAELEIRAVETGVRGRTAVMTFEISTLGETVYQVRCPCQTVSAEATRKRYRARFDKQLCADCPFAAQCPTHEGNHYRTYYFTPAQYLAQQRHRAIQELPPERRSLRANVEATVKEFRNKMPGNKLKVRGWFKTMVFAFSTAVGINFGRIYRYLGKAGTKPATDAAL